MIAFLALQFVYVKPLLRGQCFEKPSSRVSHKAVVA